MRPTLRALDAETRAIVDRGLNLVWEVLGKESTSTFALVLDGLYDDIAHRVPDSDEPGYDLARRFATAGMVAVAYTVRYLATFETKFVLLVGENATEALREMIIDGTVPAAIDATAELSDETDAHPLVQSEIAAQQAVVERLSGLDDDALRGLLTDLRASAVGDPFV